MMTKLTAIVFLSCIAGSHALVEICDRVALSNFVGDSDTTHSEYWQNVNACMDMYCQDSADPGCCSLQCGVAVYNEAMPSCWPIVEPKLEANKMMLEALGKIQG